MIKYYKCELLTDLVVNNSVATTGHVSSLDFIPGSNFLGIIAQKMYNKFTPQTAHAIFHSGKVKFGDGLPFHNHKIFYPMPLSFYQDKNERTDNPTHFVHHLLYKSGQTNVFDEHGKKIQLKQRRDGFVSIDGSWIKEVKKKINLKTARDYEKGTTKKGILFGYEAILKGNCFVFQINFTDLSLEIINQIEQTLIGKHRIGKSKYSEFGEVEISNIDYKSNLSNKIHKDWNVIYLQSPLCLFDQYGQPNLNPTAIDLGFTNANINWTLSQVQTFEYCNWNGKRNVLNPSRHCLAAGSVLYIEGDINRDIDLSNNYELYLGRYQSEGLGHCILNPFFLQTEHDYDKPILLKLSKINITPNIKEKKNEKKPNSLLNDYLIKKAKENNEELLIYKYVNEYMNSNETKTLKKSGIKNSQWGVIRRLITNSKDIAELKIVLFAEYGGYLCHGKIAREIWLKNNRCALNAFRRIVEKADNDLTIYSKKLLIKFVAEIVK